MRRILVTGGTGTLGSLVVPRLVAAGEEVRVLSRRATATVPGDGVAFVAGGQADVGAVPRRAVRRRRLSSRASARPVPRHHSSASIP